MTRAPIGFGWARPPLLVVLLVVVLALALVAGRVLVVAERRRVRDAEAARHRAVRGS